MTVAKSQGSETVKAENFIKGQKYKGQTPEERSNMSRYSLLLFVVLVKECY